MNSTLLRLARFLAVAPLLWFATVAAADDEFLPVKLAFKHSAAIVNGELTVNYQIAPGYYLYRDRLGFEFTPCRSQTMKATDSASSPQRRA